MSISYKKFRNRLSGDDILVQTRDKERSVGVSEFPKDVKLENMDKLELDNYAKEHDGIELDRRQTKTNMIKEFLTKLKGE